MMKNLIIALLLILCGGCRSNEPTDPWPQGVTFEYQGHQITCPDGVTATSPRLFSILHAVKMHLEGLDGPPIAPGLRIGIVDSELLHGPGSPFNGYWYQDRRILVVSRGDTLPPLLHELRHDQRRSGDHDDQQLWSRTNLLGGQVVVKILEERATPK